jgi:hypothetical protein
MSEAKNKVKHSPLPWRNDGVTIADAHDREVAETWGNQPSKLAIPDAVLIVEAVNNYEQLQADRDALLEALTIVRDKLVNELREPARTAFWTAVMAIKAAEQHQKGEQ